MAKIIKFKPSNQGGGSASSSEITREAYQAIRKIEEKIYVLHQELKRLELDFKKDSAEFIRKSKELEAELEREKSVIAQYFWNDKQRQDIFTLAFEDSCKSSNEQMQKDIFCRLENFLKRLDIIYPNINFPNSIKSNSVEEKIVKALDNNITMLILKYMADFISKGDKSDEERRKLVIETFYTISFTQPSTPQISSPIFVFPRPISQHSEANEIFFSCYTIAANLGYTLDETQAIVDHQAYSIVSARLFDEVYWEGKTDPYYHFMVQAYRTLIGETVFSQISRQIKSELCDDIDSVEYLYITELLSNNTLPNYVSKRNILERTTN